MPKSLETFLEQVSGVPGELTRVSRSVDPDAFEVTAILEHLERRGDTSAVIFENPKNLLGEPSGIRLVSNVFATRERIARAIDHPPEESLLPLSLEMATRDNASIEPSICVESPPVQEQVMTGSDVDVRKLPIVRHYEKDLGPVLTMVVAIKDPDEGFYELSFAKTFYKGSPVRMGASMHSLHLARVLARYKELGRPAPVMNILAHHPAFNLGSLQPRRSVMTIMQP